MFGWLFSWFQTPKTSHEKLIKTIEERNKAEALKLITAMNITELSKVDDNNETALTLAANKDLEKVCEALIPKMSDQAINCKSTNSSWFGFTAFTWVTLNEDKKICELLIPKTSLEVIINILKLEKEKQFMIEAINNYNNTLVKELN